MRDCRVRKVLRFAIARSSSTITLREAQGASGSQVFFVSMATTTSEAGIRIGQSGRRRRGRHRERIVESKRRGDDALWR